MNERHRASKVAKRMHFMLCVCVGVCIVEYVCLCFQWLKFKVWGKSSKRLNCKKYQKFYQFVRLPIANLMFTLKFEQKYTDEEIEIEYK